MTVSYHITVMRPQVAYPYQRTNDNGPVLVINGTLAHAKSEASKRLAFHPPDSVMIIRLVDEDEHDDSIASARIVATRLISGKRWIDWE